MIIRIKHKMSFAEADQLIERYYEGLTDGAEEKRLRDFLSQTHLPGRYAPEQAVFGFFESKKKKKHFSIQPYIRWASVAMLVLTVGLLVQKFAMDNRTDYAYVDGKKITDIRQVRSYAENSLRSVAAGEGNESIDPNGKDLMKQQLSVFSE